MKDCVIICGYPTNADGTISDILKSRIDHAITLYFQKQVTYLIVSGGAIHNQYNEALTMQHYALTEGVKPQHILIEPKAKSTYHNILYAKEIMIYHHFQTCYVLTNSWHIIKAKYYAKKFELDFKMVSCPKPKSMSYSKVMLLSIYMPINMLINRFKGYK